MKWLQIAEEYLRKDDFSFECKGLSGDEFNIKKAGKAIEIINEPTITEYNITLKIVKIKK